MSRVCHYSIRCQRLSHKEERRKFDNDHQVIKHRSLSLLVVMQWARPYRRWLFSLGRSLIMSFPMEKFRGPFMAWLIQDGWIKSCSPNGFLHISSNTLFLEGLCYSSSTAIPPTSPWSWSRQLQKRTVNPWTRRFSVL